MNTLTWIQFALFRVLLCRPGCLHWRSPYLFYCTHGHDLLQCLFFCIGPFPFSLIFSRLICLATKDSISLPLKTGIKLHWICYLSFIQSPVCRYLHCFSVLATQDRNLFNILLAWSWDIYLEGLLRSGHRVPSLWSDSIWKYWLLLVTLWS